MGLGSLIGAICIEYMGTHLPGNIASSVVQQVFNVMDVLFHGTILNKIYS